MPINRIELDHRVKCAICVGTPINFDNVSEYEIRYLQKSTEVFRTVLIALLALSLFLISYGVTLVAVGLRLSPPLSSVVIWLGIVLVIIGLVLLIVFWKGIIRCNELILTTEGRILDLTERRNIGGG